MKIGIAGVWTFGLLLLGPISGFAQDNPIPALCGQVKKVLYSPKEHFVLQLEDVTAYTFQDEVVWSRASADDLEIKIKGDSESNLILMGLLNSAAQAAQTANLRFCIARKSTETVNGFVIGVGETNADALHSLISDYLDYLDY